MNPTVLKEKKGEHPFGDAGQLILFIAFLAVWIADSFFLHLSTFVAANVSLALRLAFLSLILFVTGLLFRSAGAVVHHGKRPDHVLATGAFFYVRHPLYLGVLLIYLGMSVATLSIFSLAVSIVIFIFYNYIAGYEEKLLEARFGEAYLSYEAKTGKWLPGIGMKRGVHDGGHHSQRVT